MKSRGRHIGDLLVTGCNRGCHSDNLRCSQRRKGRQCDDLLVSVVWPSPITVPVLWIRGWLSRDFLVMLLEWSNLVPQLHQLRLESAPVLLIKFHSNSRKLDENHWRYILLKRSIRSQNITRTMAAKLSCKAQNGIVIVPESGLRWDW